MNYEISCESKRLVAYFMLSGGLDSAVAAFYAKKELRPEILKAIFISRLVEGADVHKAYLKEKLYAKMHAKWLGVSEKNFYEFKIPFSWYADFKRKQADIYPYGRNLVYIAVAASFISMDMKLFDPQGKAYLVLGFNRDDGHDAKKDFVHVMEKAIELGTYKEYAMHKLIELYTPFIDEHKSSIIKYASENKIDWVLKNSWSCYFSEDVHCGKCNGCVSRKEAFRIAGVPDPTEYKY